MGFTTGFTGGVTLTLSLAYLTVLAHQRNREQQASILRAQHQVLHGLIDPVPAPLPPTRAEVAAIERANLIESAKDRWNAEVEHAVHWVQNKDWEEVRDGLELAVGRLWNKVVSNAEQKGEVNAGALERVPSDAKTTVAAGVEKTKAEASGIISSARGAFRDAKAQAKSKGEEAVAVGEQKAGEAKGSIKGAISKGLEKAKYAVGLAEEKAEGAVNTVESKVKGDSGVERALRQRYEKPSGVKESVTEALAKRYTPIDQRDNSVLRGV